MKASLQILNENLYKLQITTMLVLNANLLRGCVNISSGSIHLSAWMKEASYNLHLSFSCNLSLTTIQFFREIHIIKCGTHWIVRSKIAKNRGTANGKVYLILYTVAEVNLQQWHGQDGKTPELINSWRTAAPPPWQGPVFTFHVVP